MSAPYCPDYVKLKREREAEALMEWHKPWRKRLRVARVILLALTFPIWGGPAVVIWSLIGLVALIAWLFNGDPKPEDWGPHPILKAPSYSPPPKAR